MNAQIKTLMQIKLYCQSIKTTLYRPKNYRQKRSKLKGVLFQAMNGYILRYIVVMTFPQESL